MRQSSLTYSGKRNAVHLKQIHAYTQAALMTMDMDVFRGKLDQLRSTSLLSDVKWIAEKKTKKNKLKHLMYRCDPPKNIATALMAQSAN